MNVDTTPTDCSGTWYLDLRVSSVRLGPAAEGCGHARVRCAQWLGAVALHTACIILTWTARAPCRAGTAGPRRTSAPRSVRQPRPAATPGRLTWTHRIQSIGTFGSMSSAAWCGCASAAVSTVVLAHEGRRSVSHASSSELLGAGHSESRRTCPRGRRACAHDVTTYLAAAAARVRGDFAFCLASERMHETAVVNCSRTGVPPLTALSQSGRRNHASQARLGAQWRHPTTLRRSSANDARAITTTPSRCLMRRSFLLLVTTPLILRSLSLLAGSRPCFPLRRASQS